jgi:DNA-binding Xre family transcriptional regulator
MTRKKIKANWLLRLRLAERGIFSTTDLMPLLEERGIRLSRMQVYRLVAEDPIRVSLEHLAALCDILSCTPSDLIEISHEATQKRRVAGERATLGADVKPVRAKIRRR